MAVSHLCESCRECSIKTACVEQAIGFLQGMRGDSENLKRERLRLAAVRQQLVNVPLVGAVPNPKQSARRAPTGIAPDQERVIAGLATHLRVTARKLFATGWFDHARREMLAGRNPGRNDWQRVMCDALMRGLPRAQLQLAFQEQMGLSSASAKVRTSNAVNLFTAGRLLIETEGRLQIRQN